MSSFTVSDETINTIATCIGFEAFKDSYIQRRFKELGFDIREGWEKTLAIKLLMLNREAVFQLYGKLSDIEQRAVNDFEYISRNRFQILKSIQCFLYQCSEGNIPETSELYKLLMELEHKIMHEIIDSMKEYQMPNGTRCAL
jgi:hypothetical protein